MLKEQKQQSARDVVRDAVQQNPSEQADWMTQLRHDAKARFENMGVPHKKDEYWKYADPVVLVPREPFRLSEAKPDASVSVDQSPFNQACTKLIFVNGQFRADLSDDLNQTQKGLKISLLSQVASNDQATHWSREILGQLEAMAHEKVDRPLLTLNTALMQEGVLIEVSGRIEKPVLVHHITDAADKTGILFTRNVIAVREGADFTLLESGQYAYNANTVTEVQVEKSARFNHVKIYPAYTHAAFSGLVANIAEEGIFKSFTLSQDGELLRNEAVLTLSGKNASGHIAGGTLARDSSKIDNTVFVTHAAESGESRQVYKNILDNKSRSIFQGKIYVKQIAQKTDGYQISQSVILSDKSVFSAKPELEIYADDVKCSHGSTTGALDETALFYLRSRGVSAHEAEALLIRAFLEDAIQEVEDETVQADIRTQVDMWMKQREPKH